MVVLVCINTIIFVLLSILHIYWAGGGKWALSTALPEKPGGEKSMNPGILATLVVAFGLLLFAVLTLGNLGLFDAWLNRNYINYSMLVIGIIFILRATGDFNYVGMTKKIRNTKFAEYDNRIYIPLCLVLASVSLILFFL
jgi:hypothetical protein